MGTRGNAGGRVTLQTIADRVGVSRATVSYAFSRPDQISQGLRERILRVAQELGYAGPDATARSLRLRRAGALGLLLTETLQYAFADPYSIAFLEGLAGAVQDAGVGLLVLPLPRGDMRPDIVRDAVVDAFCVHSLPDGHPALAEVLSRRLPTVLVDEPYLPGHFFVGIDEPAAGADAARHLLELGHRRLAVLATGLYHDRYTGWSDLARQRRAVFQAQRERVGGYRDAAVAAGLDWGEVPVYEISGNTRAGAREAAHTLLGVRPRPTAVLAVTDVLALGVLDAAADLGLEVPRDLSVVGFSDSAAREAGLTTIHQPGQEAGRTAGRLLLTGDPSRPERVLLPHRLVPRRSSGPPPAGRRGECGPR